MRATVAVLLAFALLGGLDRGSGQASGDMPFAAREIPAIVQAEPTVRQPPPAREDAGVVSRGPVPAGFTSATVAVNGTNLHYVAGGEGRGLILLHDFPQDWSAYAEIMPELAAKFRVVAVDLRGIGGSAPTPNGYDVATLAEDIFQLAQQLGLDQPYVAGHGLGGGVAYALARLHPTAVRGVMLLDAAVAGVEPWDNIVNDPAYWPIRFHQAPGLAEQLIAGQEAIYFTYLLRSFAGNPSAISDADIERYARAYKGPGQLAAAMKMFRAFAENERFGRQRRGPLDVEFTLVGGAVPSNGLGPRLDAIAQGLTQAGLNPPMTHQIAGSGHYVIAEKPADVAGLIDRQASKSDREPLPTNTGKFDRFSF